MQIKDHSVILDDLISAIVAFTAPDLSADQQLVFSLTVEDDKGESSKPDTVAVTIKTEQEESEEERQGGEAEEAGEKEENAENNYAETEDQRKGLQETAYQFVRSWGSKITGEIQLDTPSAVAVDFFGNVYVVDTLNHRIQKFTADGTFITI